MAQKVYSTDFHPFIREALAVWNLLRNWGFPSKSIKLWMNPKELVVRVLVTLSDEDSFSIEIGDLVSEQEMKDLIEQWKTAAVAWNDCRVLDAMTMLKNSVIYSNQDQLRQLLQESNLPVVGEEKSN